MAFQHHAILAGDSVAVGPLPGPSGGGVQGSKSAFFTHTIPRRPPIKNDLVLCHSALSASLYRTMILRTCFAWECNQEIPRVIEANVGVCGVTANPSEGGLGRNAIMARGERRPQKGVLGSQCGHSFFLGVNGLPLSSTAVFIPLVLSIATLFDSKYRQYSVTLQRSQRG